MSSTLQGSSLALDSTGTASPASGLSPSTGFSTQTTATAVLEGSTTSAITNVFTSIESSSNPSYPPLTIIFTPPSDCTNHVWSLTGPTKTFFDETNIYAAIPETCRPSQLVPTGVSAYGLGTFSPGVCPLGHTSDRLPSLESPALATPITTTALCCPSGMRYNDDQDFCTTLLTTSVTVVESGSSFTFGSSTWFIGNILPITVMWAENDLSLFTPASAPILARETSTRSIASSAPLPGTNVSTSTSTATSVSSFSTASPPPQTIDHPSPSPGGKIGIGVGVACGAMLIFACVCYLVYRLRRGRAKTEVEAELDASSTARGHADVSGLHEVGSRQLPAEGDFMSAKHELDAGWHGQEVEGEKRNLGQELGAGYQGEELAVSQGETAINAGSREQEPDTILSERSASTDPAG